MSCLAVVPGGYKRLDAPPIGVLLLSVQVVQRALQFWQTGIYANPQKTANYFSIDNRGDSVIRLALPVPSAAVLPMGAKASANGITRVADAKFTVSIGLLHCGPIMAIRALPDPPPKNPTVLDTSPGGQGGTTEGAIGRADGPHFSSTINIGTLIIPTINFTGNSLPTTIFTPNSFVQALNLNPRYLLGARDLIPLLCNLDQNLQRVPKSDGGQFSARYYLRHIPFQKAGIRALISCAGSYFCVFLDYSEGFCSLPGGNLAFQYERDGGDVGSKLRPNLFNNTPPDHLHLGSAPRDIRPTVFLASLRGYNIGVDQMMSVLNSSAQTNDPQVETYKSAKAREASLAPSISGTRQRRRWWKGGEMGGNGGIGEAPQMKLEDEHHFRRIDGGIGGKGGEGGVKSGNEGTSQRSKFGNQLLSVDGKAVNVPLLTVDEFCKQYRLSDAIRSLLHKEGFQTASALLEMYRTSARPTALPLPEPIEAHHSRQINEGVPAERALPVQMPDERADSQHASLRISKGPRAGYLAPCPQVVSPGIGVGDEVMREGSGSRASRCQQRHPRAEIPLTSSGEARASQQTTSSRLSANPGTRRPSSHLLRKTQRVSVQIATQKYAAEGVGGGAAQGAKGARDTEGETSGRDRGALEQLKGGDRRHPLRPNPRRGDEELEMTQAHMRRGRRSWREKAGTGAEGAQWQRK
ncbi:hypothetical protein FB451DRAFT_1374673 [Mycena latifolia]|nr:hypothetical protein FB451DRAFT_1374673 [Mycena latifolia]